MARDRLAHLAFRWGAVAVAIQLWIAFAFVTGLREDVTDWLKTAPIDQLPARYSQLKPWWIKSPLGLGLTALFVMVLVALVVAMFWAGLRRLRDARDGEHP
jgi:hypothetical protein